VFGFAFALSHSRDFAEDVTQSTFVEVWKSLPSYGGRSTMRTWIHRIAYRQYLRKREGRAEEPIEHVDPGTVSHETGVVDAAWLHAAVESLPHDLRETFVLFYVQELSGAEVGEILGVPRGTVLSRLHSARDRLRRLLTVPNEGEPRADLNGPTEPGVTSYEMRKASI
jgi:RNA polymerase sigma-70 factor (ECF subfamily)